MDYFTAYSNNFQEDLANIIHDCVEVYMADFTAHGNTFQEAVDNLKKVLIQCQETNLTLSHDKCKILLT